ncbi:GSCFA domain-containing protein [Hymenobacter sp. CRA2]|uniref:GSCFA domain-containing protein n=1 Tax=Hymenobacter sp. CRA2 TaxID=1955620 RepID=UPI00098F2BC4|nr:GSCFA domain-containing protein [Hymenobacter sp. CRA2]OON69166.1 hypothetical protein B0919_10730 [Hymenobacter sp. CRA2]
MFRTELSLRPAAQLLNQGARVLTIGSCFSDVIGEQLAGHKVRTLANPFGTVFNPLAAARLLRAVAGEDTDWQQHLVEARGRWQSYDLHATVGADSPPALLERIEQTVRETAAFARRADVLVWTLGTAYGYRLRDTGEVVNNCHKVPAERFDKELLTAEEIVSAVTEAYALLRQQNPKLRLVLTVSPVRHLKDTLPLNAVSKSVLRVACHYLSELLPGASYFPAYELLLDDLRDYRFYASDMLHPSEVAEQYIWEKFTQVYFDANFKQFVHEWEGIQRSLNHRPLHEGAPEHREFLEQTQKRLERLLSRNVDVRLELLDVQDRLAALPPPPPPAPAEDVDDGEERIDIGYEDATAPATPRVEPEVVAPAPVKAEPTWAEILAAEEEPAEETADATEELEDAAGVVNEAEAALPGEAGAGKRRKRKRGGRKHKKKGNRSAEEQGGPADASEANEVITEAMAEPAVAEGTVSVVVEQAPAPEEEPANTTAEQVTEPVELPAAEEPIPASSKRRKRPNRKKPALYAEQVPGDEPSAELQAERADEPAAVASVPVELPVPEEPEVVAESAAAESATPAISTDTAEPDSPAEVTPQRPGRRPARGGRKTKAAAPGPDASAEALPAPAVTATPAILPPVEPVTPLAAPEAEAPQAPAPPRRRAAPRRKAAEAAAPAPAPDVPAVPDPTPETPPAPKKRSRPPRRKPDTPETNS